MTAEPNKPPVVPVAALVDAKGDAAPNADAPAAGANEKEGAAAVVLPKGEAAAAPKGDAVGAAAAKPPDAPIFRAKSALVSLIPCVSHGRADKAAGAAVAAGFVAAPPAAAPILRAKSALASVMPCVSHGRADEAAGVAALPFALATTGAE